jgi:hypothetical protein
MRSQIDLFGTSGGATEEIIGGPSKIRTQFFLLSIRKKGFIWLSIIMAAVLLLFHVKNEQRSVAG